MQGAALMGATVASRSVLPKTTTESPNIILITADDLGWHELGCYGNPDIKTPNLDELAGGGVLFTNAFVTAPSCSASRASIITGQAPHSVHVLGLTNRYPKYQLSASVPNLPKSLRDAGLSTGIQGKWHVAPFKSAAPYGYESRMSFMKIHDSAKAKRFITKNKARPFYLELNFMQCHRPDDNKHVFRMDPDFYVDPDSIRVPSYWRIPDWPEIREDVAAFYSQTARMDHMIGEILAHLESEGVSGRTLVIFVSDNGPPYPGCKTTCYDRGIGVPMIMSWPDGLPAGEVREGLVSTIDIMPTCLEAASVSVPGTVQGNSLLALARGETDEVHDEVFAEVTFHVLYTPMRAIRTRQFKYIENLSDDPTMLDQCAKFEWAQRAAREPGQKCCVPRPPEELFDIVADPDEDVNLADDPAYKEIKAGLKRTLHKWRKDTRDPFPDLS